VSGNNWKDEAFKLFLEMDEYYEHLHGLNEIARKLGKSPKTIRRLIEENGWRERWRELIQLSTKNTERVSSDAPLEENVRVLARNAAGKFAKRLKSGSVEPRELLGIMKLGLETMPPDQDGLDEIGRGFEGMIEGAG